LSYCAVCNRSKSSRERSRYKCGVCLMENGLMKTFFKFFFYVCLSLEKLVNGKYFLVKEKFGFISRKLFSFYFGWKTLFESCEKFRNIILFVDYIKFSPQTFDCYIYIFCFEYFFFNFIPYNLIFILTLDIIFIIVICFFFIIF
jgi:hypothetical protein